MHAWFLKIAFVHKLGMHVHVREYVHVYMCAFAPRLLITIGMIQMQYDWLNLITN